VSPARTLSKPSTPRLSEAAAHFVLPDGIVATGWGQIEAKGAELGIGFDWWQQSLGRAVLGKRADGKYAATIGGVVMSIPRQVGKTYFVGALLVLMCIVFPNFKVVWTAHRTRTATNTFRSLQGLAKRKKIAPYISHIRTANGEQEIGFRNGSVIMFGAREQGFGRGFDEIDIEVFDEAQILTEKALEDMIAATNQARHPHGALLFYMGTPPRPVDPGEAFTLKRRKALALVPAGSKSAVAGDMLYLECSADPGADPDDRKQWAKANFSFPQRTPLESMLRLRENLASDEAWYREALGIWDELQKSYAFGAGKWEGCALKVDPGPHVDAIALAVSMDRLWASIGAAGALAPVPPMTPRMMVAEVYRREGTGWLVPEAWRIHQERNCPVVVARSAADLIPALEAAGFTVRNAANPTGSLIVARSGDSQDACAQMFDRVQQGILAHANHDELDKAVYGAHRRTINGERWVWDRKNSETDVSMLEAVTLAQWQASEVQDTDVWELWT
jgi:hypothetical protein